MRITQKQKPAHKHLLYSLVRPARLRPFNPSQRPVCAIQKKMSMALVGWHGNQITAIRGINKAVNTQIYKSLKWHHLFPSRFTHTGMRSHTYMNTLRPAQHKCTASFTDLKFHNDFIFYQETAKIMEIKWNRPMENKEKFVLFTLQHKKKTCGVDMDPKLTHKFQAAVKEERQREDKRGKIKVYCVGVSRSFSPVLFWILQGRLGTFTWKQNSCSAAGT